MCHDEISQRNFSETFYSESFEEKYVWPLNKVAESLKLKEPIHPKYGIQLPVLNSIHAYDLDEQVLLHGKMIQKDFKQFNVQRRTVTDIDRCVAENEPDFT